MLFQVAACSRCFLDRHNKACTKYDQHNSMLNYSRRTLAVHVSIFPDPPLRHSYRLHRFSKSRQTCMQVPRASVHRITWSRDEHFYTLCAEHETYHIPPAAFDRSNTVTLIPSFLRCAAVTTPLIPAPMTATRFPGLIMIRLLTTRSVLLSNIKITVSGGNKCEYSMNVHNGSNVHDTIVTQQLPI
jgi:hypothetical protein